MKILKNSTFKNVETEKIVKEQVSSIIEDIKINKDEALKKYNLKFDNNDRDMIRVSKEEIEGAIEKLGKGASVRGEALTLAEFAQLANYFCDLREK